MKKVINKKLYNTETAEKLGEYEPNPYHSDFHWFCETLYRTKSGNFFLHGDGNAASKYSRSCGQNEWCSDEKIVPLSYDEAQEWAEKHLDGDDYINIFGEPEESNDKLALNVRISKPAYTRLRQLAAKQKTTLANAVEELVNMQGKIYIFEEICGKLQGETYKIEAKSLEEALEIFGIDDRIRRSERFTKSYYGDIYEIYTDVIDEYREYKGRQVPIYTACYEDCIVHKKR